MVGCVRVRVQYSLSAIILIVLAVGAGCSNSEDVTKNPSPTAATQLAEPTSSVPPASGSPTPTAAWTDCGDGFDCATVPVPMDPENPTGTKLDISLIRVPASGQARGSVFVNPGGPGASGIDFVRSGFRLDQQSSQHYHLIGFDPRGSGSSTTLACSADLSQGPLADRSPDTGVEAEQLRAEFQRIASKCTEANSELMPYLTAEAIAADLDVLRQSVGDDKLHYVGFSYGTLIGLRYIEQFADRVGHLVLDGVVDPSADLESLLLQQAEAFSVGFQTMDRACSTRLDCPPGGLVATYDRVMRTLERAGSNGQVGPAELEIAILTSLYSEQLWPVAASALARADEGDYAGIGLLSDLYFGQTDFVAYASVSCADTPHPVGDSQWDELVDRLAAVSPRFGAAIANELRVCAYWPVSPSIPPAHVSTDESVSFLLVGTTGDAATPLANAQDVAGLNPGAVLVEVEGDHHTAYNSNKCVRDIVGAYLNQDALPPSPTTC